MRTIISILLLFCSTAYADELMVIAPMTDGRPPVVEGADYDWSCMGRCDAGEPDAILQITTPDVKVAEALKATKGVTALATDTKTGEVYEPGTKRILTATSLARVGTKPVEYKAELKVVDEKPVEELPK